MSAISICFGLLIALFAVPLLYADAPGQTADRWVRITKDVPVLRIDHISLKGMLLRVWPVSYSRECDPGSREIERRWGDLFDSDQSGVEDDSQALLAGAQFCHYSHTTRSGYKHPWLFNP
jgi:hypothetical protein